ncbi:uncharacterized protein [Epargyreus clarus]|uniref:uncharacterized protein n=1 Tax=Epargyreus clarus TaxID=520877 RepID=UPI003C2ECC78
MRLTKIMVLFVIIGCACGLSQTIPQINVTMDNTEIRNQIMRKNMANCTEESKVNPDVVMKFRTGKWKRIGKEPLSLKKWALCILVKADMMSQEGVLKQDVVLASIPEKDRDKAERVIDKCLYKKRHSAIDIAWHYIRCFRNRLPKYSII